MVTRAPRALLLLALAAIAALSASAALPGAGAQGPAPQANPIAGNGMWIWYVSRAAGGNVNRIARRARNRNIKVVFIKSGDAGHTWSQFTPQLVSALKSRGLRVCAWQFVYGRRPKAEAWVGAQAKRRGADCLVIDAEGHYEGRYAKASTYIRSLRRRVGASYPVGLTTFPYVDYHPSFPYSVFLGPGGAQYNLPQIYWKTIGDTVKGAFDRTWVWNRQYNRPILPLGQVYLNPPPKQIRRFRKFARAHGFAGVSWWSWQHARPRGWRAVGRRIVPNRRIRPYESFPFLRQGSRGDVVVWAQQLLAGGGYIGTVTGYFGNATRLAVVSFQGDRGLAQTGKTDTATWKAMLAHLKPLSIRWTRRGAVRASARNAMPEPWSARLPARAYEIPPGPRR